MPKQSKVTKSSPGTAAPVKDRPEKYYCTRCPRNFTKQKGNFPAAQSPMYRENGGYLPVCRHCVEEMFQHYKAALGDEKSAIRRICMKFDIYWNDQIYAMLNKASTSASRISTYISKSNMFQFVGKTFDDTLDEETGVFQRAAEATDIDASDIIASVGEDITITSEMMEFWGAGFAPSFYIDLERRLKYWTGNTDRNAMDVSECAIIRQICMLEVTIARDTAVGKQTDKSVNALNNLLGSANLKPVQKRKDENMDAIAESRPFGVWIRKIENTRPISEPDPSFKDVDGIIRYISVWFFGHLCKMLKINNKYSRLYEEEMAKLRVERPEYEGEDDEFVIEDIFARAEANGAEHEVGDAYDE